MTQTFKVRATVRVTYEYEVRGDTIEEVVEFVEAGVIESACHEIVNIADRSMTEYAVEGQMGWNKWENT